jgi:putative ABC transport system permease protein
MFRNYFKTAIKNLWRSKVFSFINIAGLSVGLACCILILLYTKDEVSYDRFHQKKDRIYRITADMLHPDGSTSMKIGNTGMMPGPGFKRGIPEIEDFVRVQSGNFTTRRSKEVFDQEALFADENFFSIFSFDDRR